MGEFGFDSIGTILLVEDELPLLGMLANDLREQGYVVLEAESSEKAIHLAADYRIDLLLTDVMMAGINGKELADMLRAKIPGLRCLFMSGYSLDILIEEDDRTLLIEKPFMLDKFRARVRDAFARN